MEKSNTRETQRLTPEAFEKLYGIPFPYDLAAVENEDETAFHNANAALIKPMKFLQVSCGAVSSSLLSAAILYDGAVIVDRIDPSILHILYTNISIMAPAAVFTGISYVAGRIAKSFSEGD
jgi:hypothetical protein